MNPPQTEALRMVRVSHPGISLWQSTVRQVVAQHIARGDISSRDVARHPLVQAADAYAFNALSKPMEVKAPPPAGDVGPDRLFEVAYAHAQNLVERTTSFAESIGHFANLDPLFVECIFDFVKWYWLAHRKPEYRDWKQSASGTNFGVVDHLIPGDAKVGLIGDWGTGMDDAGILLERLLSDHSPAVLIHLGDIYYSGTPFEAQHNFGAVLDRVRADLHLSNTDLRVYTLPGNHDYYSGGIGFYRLIDSLNQGGSGQTASYFCLRTSDGSVQFLGMDTGFYDRDPGVGFDADRVAPKIHDSELEWLLDKINGFPGKTILFSHHQLFSSHSALNGLNSGRVPYLNQALLDAFRPSFDRIAAWFWGHEHSLMIFEDGQFGLKKGRLIGCSAFETVEGDDPYSVNFPQVKQRSPDIQLGRDGDWYNHGCALIDLGQRSISYYQMRSWLEDQPQPTPDLALLFTEQFA